MSTNTYVQQDILDSSVKSRKSKGEFTFLQHNIAKKQEAQQTLLEIVTAKKTDYILVQEPYVWQDKTTKQWFTIPHSVYTPILPQTVNRPRVLSYIRNGSTLDYKVRTDVIVDGDI